MAGAGLKNNLGQNVCSFTSGSALRIPNVAQGWFFLEIYGKTGGKTCRYPLGKNVMIALGI